FARAEPLFRQALETHEQAGPVEAPASYAYSENLAEVYRARGEFPKAETVLLKVQEILRRSTEPLPPPWTGLLGSLASVYYRQGDYAKAEQLARQIQEIHKRGQGDKDISSARDLTVLAELHRCRGEYAKAEPLYRQALAFFKEAHGEHHPSYALTQ